ncbi:MAG: organic hydroperoxide resistance protein [Nakamurella sp.]
MPQVYRTTATSTGDGRNGHTRTDDATIDLDLATPAAQGGPGGATNPEQLFAAGYSGCFHSALKAVARTAHLDLTGSTVAVTVTLNKDDGAFSLGVDITAHLPGLDEQRAHELLEEAHQRCPYSRATRGNIAVTLNLA